MRPNGFIITLGFVAVSFAGAAGYLPNVGPVALRFERPVNPTVAVILPAPPVFPEATSEAPAHPEVIADIPVETPTNAAPHSTTLMQDLPVVLPDILTASSGTNQNSTLIGPTMDTNGIVTPQVFLRFFTPPQNGVSREAVVIPPTGFTPAPPPPLPSTATYSQPKK